MARGALVGCVRVCVLGLWVPQPAAAQLPERPRTISIVEQLETERKALFAQVADSVVFVNCGDESFGSGFFVDPSGVIATNRHVVDCKDSISVILRSGEKRSAKVALTDPLYDLALLRIRLAGAAVKALPLADSDRVEVGDYAAAVSHPVGGVWTLNEGLISNRYPARKDQYAGIIQTQVPLQPGSSGGPMLNRRGEVVGVITAKLKEGDSTGFCIQSNLVKRLVSQYQAERGGQLAVNGNLPGAVLLVDGVKQGALPALVTLPPGAHRVQVTLGGRVFQRDVEVAAGGVEQLFVRDSDLR
jgi:serine protease Do